MKNCESDSFRKKRHHKKKIVNTIQLSFAADAGNSLPNTIYSLLPFKSIRPDDGTGNAPLFPTNEFAALDLSIPVINKYYIDNILISIGSNNTLNEDIHFTFNLYVSTDNPLAATLTPPVFAKVVTFPANQTFVNDLQKVKIPIHKKSYLLVSYHTDVNLSIILGKDWWINFTINLAQK